MNIQEIFNYIRIRDLIDIFIIAILTYNCLKLWQGTRAEQLAKGIIVILILTKLSEWGKFYTIYWLLDKLMTWGIVAILVVFQPELRKGLELIGRSSSSFRNSRDVVRVPRTVTEICDSVGSLARQKIGALIIVERQTGLNEIVETGTRVDGLVSSGLIINIFIPNTPLHDGAVIVKGDRIVAASCFLPLSDADNISKELGTRHRAGIGISEKSDCLSIMVSEETGSISVAEKGKISRYLDLETLETILNKIYNPTLVNQSSLFKWKIGGEKNAKNE
ncbi:diadenylate cyclase [Peptoniphilus asaccharolyticus DSM 20463]|uniref:Diadenylate cyclase n=1 Tax=Peptoniphilus asaccharolyticus DSM 20463 TaxID=573058 RepID=A0A1W1UWL7_PEPAS|nr:diadenylate cyclase CdaA [Peptoniphilus asaccharolyticus]MBL7575267.1 TIGR00159 family protein [Peptoniphilus asaccharolyticus]SMB85181.1 diadenylate cyclase [Peptoniphilus asaccharolyticus DSM 20463]